MPGPPPKDSDQRRRTNKPRSGDWVVLPERNEGEIPALPSIKGFRWSKAIKDWWETIWRSPMATQWLDADVDGLVLLASLRQELLTATRIDDRVKLDAAIQRIGDKYGLSPKGRKDLRWVVTQEDAQSAGVRPAHLSLVRRLPAKG